MRVLSSKAHRGSIDGAHDLSMAEPLASLHDPELPASGLLFGSDAAEMIAGAIGDGAVLGAAPSQVLWLPGRRLVVRYRVTLDTPAGPVERVVIAGTGSAIPPGLVDGDPAQVLLWTPETDPHLPGLGPATNARRVTDLLATLGLPHAPVTVHLRAYRPGRRAVVEVRHPATRVFLKIVPPAEASRLHDLHRFDAGVPTPRSLGVDRTLGIVVLEAIAGRTLRDRLTEPDAAVPDPAELCAVLARLEPAPEARVVSGPMAALRRHIRLLTLVAPDAGAVLDGLAGIGDADRVADGSSPALVPVHGDYYESQILVDHGAISGIIDLDRMGAGQRVDDLATLMGHLAAWAPSSPDPIRVLRYLDHLQVEAERIVDPDLLRTATAAALVGLATGPFRAQVEGWPEAVHNRLLLAEAWRTGRHGDENSLTTASRPHHSAG